MENHSENSVSLSQEKEDLIRNTPEIERNNLSQDTQKSLGHVDIGINSIKERIKDDTDQINKIKAEISSEYATQNENNLPLNHSVYHRDLNKTISTHETKGTKVYNDKENLNRKNFEIIEKPELQFVASQIASLIMPVSPIYKEDRRMFGILEGRAVSEDFTEHANYESSNYGETFVNSFILKSILQDEDHDVLDDHNVKGGIFYDFDQAVLYQKYKYQPEIMAHTIESYKKVYEEKGYTDFNNILREKVLFLRKNLDGESGRNFLSSLCKKAGYKEYSADEIQETLLLRCNEVLKLVSSD